MWLKRYFFLVYLISICFLSNANTTDNLSLSVDGFLENQGQMMDMEGNPVPFVLFKAEAPGVNLWITEKGMTMQTFQIRRESLTGKEIEELESGNGELSEHKKTKKFIDWERVDLTLKDASIKKENIIKEDATQGHNNYFYPHYPDGIYGVKEYQKVIIQNVYPNIDWVIYRTSKSFKYDFVVHPGGDYKQIELIYHSKSPVQINEQGQLAFTTNYGNLQENKPVSFYEDKEVITQFVQNYQHIKTINGDVGYETSIGFKLTRRIKSLLTDLVIDPELVWGTYYGGSGNDIFKCMDTDNNDNLFITGYTNSTNFPTQDVGNFFQGIYGGGNNDVIILKFNNMGDLLWATYYGGSLDDHGNYVFIDDFGNVFVTGQTASTDFSLQNSGTYFQSIMGGQKDAFIIKFDTAGNRLWGTYYGGNGIEQGNSIVVNSLGDVFITGWTQSSNFPIYDAGTFYQDTITGQADAFILKFDNNGNQLWATYYGGSMQDLSNNITIDNADNIFIIGQTYSNDFPLQNSGAYFQNTYSGNEDAFILKFDNNGNHLWATYYGGNDTDRGYDITIDNIGNVIVLGQTFSSDFPLQNSGAFFQGTIINGNLFSDAFILKFDNLGNRLWATYYGGNNYEVMNTPLLDGIAIDECNNLYIGFTTRSSDITTLTLGGSNAFNDTSFGGSPSDHFITRFDDSDSLIWASYIGGDGNEWESAITIDGQNNLFYGGQALVGAGTIGFPLVNPGGSTFFDASPNGSEDGYILKFTPISPILLQSQTNSTNCISCDGEFLVSITDINSPYSYEWSTGSQTLNTTDTFDILGGLCAGNYWVTVSSGCNHVDTLFFNITEPLASSTYNPTICHGDSIIVGTSVYNTAGIYLDTLNGAASNGCDSIITTNLSIITPDTTTITSNDTIFSNQSGASYQWLDCNNGNAAISGETSQNFIPTVSGNYAVEVTLGSCVDTSSCIDITITGIQELTKSEIKIYPNPINDNITIELTSISKDTEIEIVTAEGKVVYQNSVINSKKLIIDSSTWSKGVYLVKITTLEDIQSFQLIK
jgi:hypothetical protein